MKKQSAKEGVKARVQGPHLSWGRVVPGSANPAGGMDCVEVAKIVPRPYLCAKDLIDPFRQSH
jgi:hypothetical protein